MLELMKKEVGIGLAANQCGINVRCFVFVNGMANNQTEGDVLALNPSYEVMEDAETVDVNLLFACPDANGQETIAVRLNLYCRSKKRFSCICISPIEDTVGSSTPAADVMTFANGLTSSSYAVCDSSALYVYDKYNDVFRYIGAAGHVAGLCANTDRVADAWFSPAGVNRGQLLGATKLAFNPKKQIEIHYIKDVLIL